jgi:hypothetical protein
MRHGFKYRKGDQTPPSQFAPAGKFGRMFPELPPLIPSEESLTELGKEMLDETPDSSEGDNPGVSAGFTYLGQFIDHDITFDPTSLKEKQVDPLSLTNFRTPALDLDSVYGSGPADQPFMYQLDDPDRFLIGDTVGLPTNFNGIDLGASARADEVLPVLPNDLPRAPKTGLALLGDPRNDENLIVAQLHLTFLKFHNKIVDGLKDGSIPRENQIEKSIFDEARQLVIWHYQWILLHDFLNRILNPCQLTSVLKEGRKFYNFKEHAFIPVEFSAAAYRLGHSMIRKNYDYNRIFTFADPTNDSRLADASLQLLFEFTAKSGNPATPFPGLIPTLPSNWIIDWRRFFDIDSNRKPGLSRRLDPFLVDPLAALPNVPLPNSLAVRNLLRGRSLGLPSGQRVAKFMGFKPLTSAEIASNPGRDVAVAQKFCFDKESPLWYYILKEAQVQNQGERLGEVGSRIIAEVFVGLLEGDRSSFLVQNPCWKPTLGKTPGTFTMVDLLNFVGDINPIGD